jgi:hypothetical protein
MAHISTYFQIIMSILTRIESKLGIKTNDELEDISNGEFEDNKGANFEVNSHAKFEIKTNEDFNVKEKDQDSTHHEEQNSPHQEDQDNPYYNDIVSFDTIIHQEALMTLILQDTSYDDPFLYVCHSSRSHNEVTCLIYSKLSTLISIQDAHSWVISFFGQEDHLPSLIF